ncbi:MAG TPA: DUF5808 domain-containing protein [Acidimicrobiales bacterium]|nr:DUF5808 domain-containing protein [Acidimicrobiales bacterium]
MSAFEPPSGADHEPGVPRTEQGRVGGVPYDLRRPTLAKTRSRYWNPDDPRLLTPKVFGVGWTINLYWLAHPGRWRRVRRHIP